MLCFALAVEGQLCELIFLLLGLGLLFSFFICLVVFGRLLVLLSDRNRLLLLFLKVLFFELIWSLSLLRLVLRLFVRLFKFLFDLFLDLVGDDLFGVVLPLGTRSHAHAHFTPSILYAESIKSMNRK